jgi:anti-sigma factor RsiW
MQSVTMQPHPYEDDIPAYVLGALDIEEALQISAHVAHCPACHAEVATYHALVGLLCYAIPPQEPPVHLRERILTHIAIDSESSAVTSG